MRRIVLDTNALVQMISRHSPYYELWQAYQKEKYGLCVSNDILSEYREILEEQTSVFVAFQIAVHKLDDFLWMMQTSTL